MNDDDRIIMGSLVGTSKCRAKSEFSGSKDVKKICKSVNKQWKSVKVKKDDPSQQKARAEAREIAKDECESKEWEGATRSVCEWN